MRIRDEYLHGSDLLGVVKKIEIAIGTGDNANKSVIKYTKADSTGGVIEVPIGDITGKAAAASKLDNTSAIGSKTTPVYFTANGVPSTCTYSLNATVPVGAANQVLYYSAPNTLSVQSYATLTSNLDVFTVATSSTSGKKGLVPAPTANQLGTKNFFLRADGIWAVIESKSAALNGTDTSLVTTGEKYNWNSAYNWYNSMTSGDTDGIINKWKEVEAFLANYGDSSTLAAELAKLVTLSTDQTITGVKTFSEVINGSITGNAGTANKLKNTVTINGVAFDGSANITITANPNSHSHGNITNAGAIGTAANKPIITTTNGVLTTGAFGTTANTFCEGNDSRLSDARKNPNALTLGVLNNSGAVVGTDTLYDGSSALSFKIKAGSGITLSQSTKGEVVITNAAPDVDHNTDTKVKLTATDGTATDRYIPFPETSISSGSDYELFYQSDFKYNPGTKLFSVPNVAVGEKITVTGTSALGTVTSGVWNGTPITNDYLAHKSVTINGSIVNLGESIIVTAVANGGNAGTVGGYSPSDFLLKDEYETFESIIVSALTDLDNRKIEASDIPTSLPANGGNADTATKLQTACTIWGNSFDGTKNITGLPEFPFCININRNPLTGVLLDSSRVSLEIKAFANDVRLKTYMANGENNIDHLVLTSSGKVGIGTKSPSSKLHVAGDIYTTTGFKKKDSSDSYVLLGGGGHKAISDFATANHSHSYIKQNFASTGFANVPFTGKRFEYGILIGDSSEPTDVKAFDDYYQIEYINIPWTDYNYGGQIMLGTNSGKIGYRTRHGGTWNQIKEILHQLNYTDYTVKKDGTGASGTWGINISGNATSATSLGSGALKHMCSLYALNNYNAYKITTDWHKSYDIMPTINIRGYAYGSARTIDCDIVMYHRNYDSNNYSLTNKGSYPIKVWQAIENDVQVFYINPGEYFGMFNVFVYGGKSTDRFTNWSMITVDEVSGTEIPLNPIATSITGNAATATNVDWSGVTNRPTNVSAFTNDAGYLKSHAYSYGSIDIYDINGAKKTSNNTVSASVNTETLRLQEGANISITAINSGTSGGDSIKIAVTGITSNIDRNGYGQLALWHNGVSSVSATLQSVTYNEKLTVKAGSGIDFSEIDSTANNDIWTISAIPYNCAITLNANSIKALIKDSWSADALSVYLTSNGTSSGTSLAAGTYALWIEDRSSASGTPNYYSGTFTCAGSATAGRLDEIALHSSMATSADTNAPTRIFVATQISGTSGKHVLRFCSLDSSTTNHYLTVKVNRII